MFFRRVSGKLLSVKIGYAHDISMPEKGNFVKQLLLHK